MKTVLFAPHADDEALFAAHLLMQHQPYVVICFGSERDYGETGVRTAESRAACALLGAGPVEQWVDVDIEHEMRRLDAAMAPTLVFAPALPSSHPHHVVVATAAATVFGDRLVRYHTYDEHGKVRAGHRVSLPADAAARKRQALACYETQRSHPRAKVFYDEARFELDEYVADQVPEGVDANDEPSLPTEVPSVPATEVTSQPTPPLATRDDGGSKKGKGGKGRR